jgi:hypothetical protein
LEKREGEKNAEFNDPKHAFLPKFCLIRSGRKVRLRPSPVSLSRLSETGYGLRATGCVLRGTKKVFGVQYSVL